MVSWSLAAARISAAAFGSGGGSLHHGFEPSLGFLIQWPLTGSGFVHTGKLRSAAARTSGLRSPASFAARAFPLSPSEGASRAAVSRSGKYGEVHRRSTSLTAT